MIPKLRTKRLDTTTDSSGNGGEPPAAQSSRGRWVAVGVVVVALVVVAGIVLASRGGDDAQEQAASQSTRTATIRQQDLVETEEVDGTLGYADERTVINRLSGTVTWTPSIGSVVKTNHRLYEVDGEAVYLLDGSYPAYRTLTSGTEGDDVRQLERNLRALDLDPDEQMKVDGSWDSGTTAAVKRWQERKGLAQDGSIEKGRVVFQPGSRRVSEITLSAGSSASGGGGGDGTGAAPAAYETGDVATTVFASAPATTTQADGWSDIPVARAVQDDGTGTGQTTTTPPTTTTTPADPPDDSPEAPADNGDDDDQQQEPQTQPQPQPQTQPQLQQQQGGSAPGGSAPSAGGGSAQGGGASGSGGATGESDVNATLMSTTSTERIVAVDLETTKQELASEGEEVTVELPGGEDVGGTITRVGKVAAKKATSEDEDPPATVEVVIELKKSSGTGLDRAPVDVRLEKSRARDVLAVPVTALLAQQGGDFAIEVHEGAQRRVVPVEPGLYTDGYVEIEGNGLRPGMTITVAGV